MPAASAGEALDADTEVEHRAHSERQRLLLLPVAAVRAHSAGWGDDTAPDGGADASVDDDDDNGGDCASRRRDDDAPWGRCLLPSSLGQLFVAWASC